MPEGNGYARDGDAEGGEGAPPEVLLGSEQWQWEAVDNLDQFFTRVYRYWDEKGFLVMLASRVLNLLALAFTGAMSALLLLYVDWGALRAECLKKDTCDIWEAAIRKHPLAGGLTAWTGLACAYLLLLAAYWLAALVHLAYEVRDLAEVKHFCNAKLGLSERQMGTATWPEVARRLVQVQRRHRLCMARDLTEHDIVARIMRKENYLIGMLNKGVLALSMPIPGLRRHLLLTKTLEWNLYWTVLDAMFDDRFRLKPAFLHNERALRKRLRIMAALNLAASPFLLVFLLIYFFMKNAERFYHHPSSVGARRWSPLAAWRLREFNELPHFTKHRLNASHAAAEAYIRQFPSRALSHVARFVAFVAGSVAALLLVVTLIDERLLERDLFGRQLVWWVAVVGVVLALSRAFVIEGSAAFDPEAALLEVVAHTHFLPRHWRGRAHTREVQEEFEGLFQYQALLFLEELASILLTPLLLWSSLPQCAGAVLSFVEQHTTHVEGVGDVCSLAAFDFQRHGNPRYGSPAEGPKLLRSRQGKLEKSFLSFAATYPTWEPDPAGQQLLLQLSRAAEAPPPTAGHSPTARAGAPPPRWPPGPPRPSPAALAAAALAARGYTAGARLGGASGIFGSAELTAFDGRPAHGGEGAAPEERLAASQLLLQSLYEQRSGVQQAQQPPQAASPGRSTSLPRAPAQQRGLAPPSPRQQWQQQQQGSAASPRGASQPPSSPHLRQPPQQAAAAAAAAGSPGRQDWLGRSPPGRPRVAELSLLSREGSGGERHDSGGAAAPAGVPPLQPSTRGAQQPAQPLQPPPAADAEWLLQQELLLGGGLGSSGGGLGSSGESRHGGSAGSDNEGPPDFF